MTRVGLSQLLKVAVRRFLARRGYSLYRMNADEMRFVLSSYDTNVPLPDEAELELRYDNHRLRELERRYQKLDSPICAHTQWHKELTKRAMDLRGFRGDNAYMWQYRHIRGDKRLRYYLYARYVREHDRLGLLGSQLTEDGLFGCFTFQYKEMPTVSRDLLDAVNELYFLDRHWGLFGKAGIQVLDIGAGYGRLAHRMLCATEGVSRYWCIDAVPRSTFLCEYYLRFRGLLEGATARASVIPLDEMDRTASTMKPDLAVNIHSFSEMCYDAVAAWVRWLGSLSVPVLMVVPNEPEMLTQEADGSRRGYQGLLEDAGYRLKVREPTVMDADIRQFFGVNDYFFLFERN